MSSIDDILNRIDSGDYAMPQFQRGYVWNRTQVRKLMASLYKGYPVGTVLLWQTPVEGADVKGEKMVGQGVVNLILDGQQRMTTFYGIMRGKEPPFFEGDRRAFTDLMFNINEEVFEFQAPKMKGDPMWVSVTGVYNTGAVSTAVAVKQAGGLDDAGFTVALTRLNRIEQISKTEILSQTVTGPDKTVDVVVDIFNSVNSGGTKLSKGDLTLAKVCAEWPAMRDEMQKALDGFSSKGYDFTRDWLLRCLTVHLARSAYFSALDGFSVAEIKKGLKETVQLVGTCLDHIAGRLGLDHTRVLGSPFSIATMIAVIDQGGRQARLGRVGPPALLACPRLPLGPLRRLHRERARPGHQRRQERRGHRRAAQAHKDEQTRSALAPRRLLGLEHGGTFLPAHVPACPHGARP